MPRSQRISYLTPVASAVMLPVNANRRGLLFMPALHVDSTISIDVVSPVVLYAGIINWQKGAAFNANYPVRLDQDNMGALLHQAWYCIGSAGGETLIIIETLAEGCYDDA